MSMWNFVGNYLARCSKSLALFRGPHLSRPKWFPRVRSVKNGDIVKVFNVFNDGRSPPCLNIPNILSWLHSCQLPSSAMHFCFQQQYSSISTVVAYSLRLIFTHEYKIQAILDCLRCKRISKDKLGGTPPVRNYSRMEQSWTELYLGTRF